MERTVHLSLVIPAYNEEHRIGETMRHVLDYLKAQPYDAEVIVVDDGSIDATQRIVEAFRSAEVPAVSVVSLPENRGKGYAVYTGMSQARGAYRVFYDADASTPIEELGRLWPRFEAGADVVIGSRELPDSDVQVRQRWYRQTMGRVFNVFLRLLGITRFKDTQCGFKGFSARACDVVFPRQTIHRFSFDAELLYIAQKHGLRVDEVPVCWRNSSRSRVHPLFDASRMLFDLLTIRAKDILGRYA